MTLWHAIVLGFVQGLTEFLPVSSSGHLVLAGALLGLSEGHLAFDVIVHVATLVATVVYYRNSLRCMAGDTVKAVLQYRSGRSLQEVLYMYPEARLVGLIALGSIPTALIGLVFKDHLEALFSEPRSAAGMLLVTAALLLLTRWCPRGRKTLSQFHWSYALLIGLIQGVAIVPGICRSGSTIAMALLLGLERELAARYSFLLALPAVLGALLLQMRDGAAFEVVGQSALVSGFVMAAITGLFALALLVRLVRSGRFHYFALYLVPVGLWGLYAL
ncbi:MAG: undecaprenyl-diphosphate phosphatase [Myxococcota bacterium]